MNRATMRGWRARATATPRRRLLLALGVAALLSLGLALLLHRFWASDDKPLTILYFGLYLVGSVLGLLAFALWKPGPAYYPAGKLLALAVGVPGAFYVGLYFLYGFDRARLVREVGQRGLGILIYAVIVALAGWAVFLLVRQNYFTRPGAALDVRGAEHRPSREMVKEAVEIIERADFHDLISAATAVKLRRDANARKALRWLTVMDGADDEDGGRR